MAELIIPPSASSESPPLKGDLLRWLYIGRLVLVTAILAAAMLVWFEASSEDTLVAVGMFAVALGVTAVSFWHTHWMGREPGRNFLYAQVVLDVLLVTATVHVTGGPESGFASLYILVITAGALLLPLPGGVLIGALVSMVYFADLTWGHEGALRVDVALRIVLFSSVALLTGLVGDRLRQAGQALGAVTSQLHQLRLDTGDILATLSTGVITVTGEGLLAYANPAADALLGVRLSARLGQPVVAELERIAPGLGKILEQAIRDRRPVMRARAQATTRRGGTMLGVSTAILERGENESPSVTALFQDITDHERL
ncbi:MAG TPA: PAS domain-containing protein, partial [Longimicrobiales bacterium]|nr:PAS domain-containing protein [Longimicrobiales bacterium]